MQPPHKKQTAAGNVSVNLTVLVQVHPHNSFYLHARSRAQTHTRTHAHTYAHTNARTHTHASCPHTHACAHAHTRTCAHTYKHAHTCAYTRENTCMNMCVRTHAGACARARTRDVIRSKSSESECIYKNICILVSYALHVQEVERLKQCCAFRPRHPRNLMARNPKECATKR